MALNLRPKLSDVLERHTGKIIRNFGVATPGIVTRAHTSGGVTYAVDVQPGVNRLVPSEDDEDIDVAERPAVVQFVPVIWPVGQGFKFKATLAVNDTVLLVCMDRDISAWRATGAVSDPDDARLHDYASCVAIPGLVPDTSPFPEPADAAALAGAVATELRNIALAMDTIAGAVPIGNPYPGTGPTNTQAAIKARIQSAILKLGS